MFLKAVLNTLNDCYWNDQVFPPLHAGDACGRVPRHLASQLSMCFIGVLQTAAGTECGQQIGHNAASPLNFNVCERGRDQPMFPWSVECIVLVAVEWISIIQTRALCLNWWAPGVQLQLMKYCSADEFWCCRLDYIPLVYFGFLKLSPLWWSLGLLGMKCSTFGI